VAPKFIGLILIAGGLNVLFSPHDPSSDLFIFIGLLISIGTLLILGTLFGSLQSVSIDGENLIVAYRLTEDSYKASDIKAVSWQTGLYLQEQGARTIISYRQRFPGDLGPTGDLYGQYGRYTFLLIQMKNGKKVEIPGSPYARFDMQKPLLAWQEKYNPQASESVVMTD
jgi:hypothetical protein